jgi:response regulator RpfG family c-di-GMP phosphodiesterase
MLIVKNPNSVYRIPFDFSDKSLDDLLNQVSLPMRNHSRRVAVYSAIMAEHAKDFLRPFDILTGINLPLVAHLGGTCHDIGKLLLPTLVMDEEIYLQHPVIGAELLEKHKQTLFGKEDHADVVVEIVRYHHEQPNGGGFPEGLKADDIPLIAGICAIANELDYFLYPGKAYHIDTENIFNNIKLQAGSFFFFFVVICFERSWKLITEQYIKWNTSIL